MPIIGREELTSLLNNRKFTEGSTTIASVSGMPWEELARTGIAYSFKQGDAEVTILSDGDLTLPLDVLAPEASADQIAEISRRMGWTDGLGHAAANIPLIKSGNDLILIDNGSGDKFQPNAGKLSASMQAAGVDPNAITKVVFTHAHPDHIWGTLAGESLLCPNAAYYVAGAEWDFWMSPEIYNMLPKDLHYLAQGAQRDLGAIKDRVTMVKDGDEIVPGLMVLDTAGHSPGHIALLLDGGEGLIITGDAMPDEIISFEHPKWKFGYDAVSDLAIKSRTRLVDRAAADKNKLLGYHWTFPGIGIPERRGEAYRYVPTP